MQPNTVSSTARLIAKATILNAHDKDTRHLVPPEASELSQAFLRGSSWTDRNFSSLVKLPGVPALLYALEKLIKPGLSAHYALRKQYIEELVCGRLDRGDYSQVVVVGCGFDTLALRQGNRYQNVQFFEIDSPALIAEKSGAVTAGRGKPHNLHFQALDESGSILKTLSPLSEFATVAPTLFVIEGVLMYLQHDEVKQLFHELGTIPRGSGLIFTFLQPIGAYAPEDRPLAERVADLWLKQKGESYLWSVTSEQIRSLCQEVGLEIVSMVCPKDRQSELKLRLSSRRGQIMPRDEYVAEGLFSRFDEL